MDLDDMDDIPAELRAVIAYDHKIIMGLIKGHAEIVRLARETFERHHLWMTGEEAPVLEPRPKKPDFKVVKFPK